MKNCPHCDKEISDNVNFCPYCGENLTGVTNSAHFSNEEAELKNGNLVLLFSGISLAGCLMPIVGIIFSIVTIIMTKDKKSKDRKYFDAFSLSIFSLVMNVIIMILYIVYLVTHKVI